ncbi:glycosyltransferase [Maribacter sp. ANRC-HE7]|uniref:Glycosyltransferase n=1 Tax=Maribacter aquimaris TaxID=2737171 RepID=A0ABR7UZS3_9FLAO|nr:glycosyltransferase [Maribacter aquimaris]MBD0778095.1 glycosyltransferase [Maribacter aquimaris]
MKILCVINSLCPGGAQRQLINLAIGFKRNGHEVSFLAYHNENFYTSELLENDIPTTFLVEPNYLKRLLKMRKFIRGGQYDAVLAFLEAPCFIATVSGFPYRKWKLVVGERSADPNILSSFKRRFYRWVHLFADYVVANSQTNLEMVRRINPLMPNRKCKVIYNMLRINDTANINKSNFFKDKLKMVILANQRKLKNLNGLVEAVNMLGENERKRLRINWYGERDIKDHDLEALKKIDRYGLVDVFAFHEPIKDVNVKIKESDVVGLFSHYEGFPNIICEAMILNKPVICSTVSDIPILLKEDENGFFCNPEDIVSISNALKKLLAAEKEQLNKMGDTNRILADKLFNSEVLIENYLTLLGDKKVKSG